MNILLSRIRLINNMNIMDLPDNLDIPEAMMSVIIMAVLGLGRKILSSRRICMIE
jgi:hypothetical protein